MNRNLKLETHTAEDPKVVGIGFEQRAVQTWWNVPQRGVAPYQVYPEKLENIFKAGSDLGIETTT